MIHQHLRNPCLANSCPRAVACTVRRVVCHLPRPRPSRIPVAAAYYEAGRSMGGDDAGLSSRSQQSSEPEEVLAVRRSLFALENERDDVLRIGEGAAKAAVQLSDEIAKWNDLAVARLQRADEEGARSALRAKAAASENMDKNTARAQANFALAAKIAEKIGVLQSRLVSLGALAPSPVKPPAEPQAGRFGTTAPSAVRPPAEPQAGQFGYPSIPKYEPINPSSSSSTSGISNGSPLGPNYQPQAPKWVASLEDAHQRMVETGQDAPRWQVSLEEAKRRIQEVEDVGRTARLAAEDKIAEAQDRLRGLPRDVAGRETLWEQQERLRMASEGDIVEAQRRLRGKDAEIMAYARRVVDRYRRGEFVSEDQLEFAFRQLERLSY